jgi:phosphoribosylformimino-5-aminoimidazole carboxamide ribotide isomerase
MELYVAIDLRGGRAVRLEQGDYARETRYADDPVAQARSFIEDGARWLHIVDLDAARTGDPVNRPVVAQVLASVARGAHVQVGGGIRTVEDVRALADLGATRIVIGSAALRVPDLVDEAAEIMPVAVALDHRQGELAVQGWTETSGHRVLDVLDRFANAAALVVTDITRDGTLLGPDLSGLADVCAKTSVPVIASGGVGRPTDLVALRNLPGLAGVIVGKAIYERRLTVTEAVEALR